MSRLAENFQQIRSRMAEAARRAGRDPSAVELVAVSKTFPAEVVREAAAEHDLFGESRVQEALAKIPECPSRLRWHFIGHLQSNKVRKVLPHFEAIHSVDSLELARDISRVAQEEGCRPSLYLQVNVSGEGRKFGFSPEALRACWEEVLELERLSILGLMTIPPLAREPEAARPHFAALRELADELAAHAGLPALGLSMGMSGDFEIAIEEGSTIVRVGSALFGARRSQLTRRAAAE